jgi:hypothetical protein
MTAGALLVGTAIHRHTSAKGDAAPNWHPLIRLLLDQLPPQRRERYAGWCAEAILISDRLWEAEAKQGSALTIDAARSEFAGSVIEVVHIREPGDPLHGTPCPPCRSCQVLLDTFGIEVNRPTPAADGPPSGFGQAPDRVRRWVLTVAGYAAVDGRHHEVVDAAREAYQRFGGEWRPAPDGGLEVAASGFAIDPTLALHTVHTLGALGEAVGARMSPLGIEVGGPGLLAVDERGRLFVIDHTAEWFLGDTVEQGLATLLAGRAPRRVRVDGTW